MPDETRRQIGKTLATHAPLQLPDEALDARAAVALVLRPASVVTADEQTANGGARAPAGQEKVVAGLGAELLFVQRAVVDRDPWSGHMALPGGRQEPIDANLMETALRELREETTLKLQASNVIGRLDEVAPGNPSLPAIGITPFVAWHDTGAGVGISAEVRDHVWVPLPVMQDDAYRSVLQLQHRGKVREFPTIEFRGYTIWGLTHRIVMNFLAVLRGEATSPGFATHARNVSAGRESSRDERQR